jgi:uncharacterized protein YecE (DUF72 family)
LPRGYAHAIEFRHPSWLDKEVEDLLKSHRIATVSVSSQAMPMYLKPTANFVYVRFHGLKGESAHDYTDSELEPWAEHLRRCARQGLKGFVYFNNDVNTRAPLNARRLIEMVGSSDLSIRYQPDSRIGVRLWHPFIISLASGVY